MAIRRMFAAAALAAAVRAMAATADAPAVVPSLSGDEIVQRNIAARGGADAWRRVETMAWVGHVENSRAAAPSLPFLLEMKRPNRTHFEITATSERFLRIFDGVRGWKVRPSANGIPDVQPFSMDEMQFAREEFVIDGPLLDHQAKRIAVSLEGVDEVAGRRAYRLGIRLPSGAPRRIWLDAESFLDLKHERPSSNALVAGAAIPVFYRDYRTVDGLQIPHRIETGMATGNGSSTLVLDQVLVNPALSERAFMKPAVPTKRRATVSVGGESPPWRGR